MQVKDFEFEQTGPKQDSGLLRIGHVKSTGAKGTVLDWGHNSDDTKAYMRLGSYTPKVGDQVLTVKYRGSYYILGKLVH